MMYSITEAIYDTYTTAAFLRVPQRTHRHGSWVEPRRHVSGLQVALGRPVGRLLTRGRSAAGRALSALGAVLQAGGNRLIGTQPARPA